MFYLEDPAIMKYGKKDKPLSTGFDLSFGARVIVNQDSRTKFKVIVKQKRSGSTTTLSLRAETTGERDTWVSVIQTAINQTLTMTSGKQGGLNDLSFDTSQD